MAYLLLLQDGNMLVWLSDFHAGSGIQDAWWDSRLCELLCEFSQVMNLFLRAISLSLKTIEQCAHNT